MKFGERQLMMGNDACAAGAIAAGVGYFAAYPITPATEIGEILSRELPYYGGKFLQMEDEMGALGSCLGASVAGVKAMTASSGPGISLMQENVGLAAMAEIPVVIINVQRVGPGTGTIDQTQADVMQARWGTNGDHPVIALAPQSVKECFDLTVRAVNLSEQFRVPVYLLSDAQVGHMREVVTLPRLDEVHRVDRPRPTCRREEYHGYEFRTPDEVPAPADPAPVAGEQVARELRSCLDDLATQADLSPRLAAFCGHLDKVSASYWPGLFHCYAIEGLPRTNNELESHFRDTQRRLLRTSGQKGQTRRALHRSGAWELLPGPPNEAQRLAALRQIPRDQFVQEQDRFRRHQQRFRLHTRSIRRVEAQFDKLREQWRSLAATSMG